MVVDRVLFLALFSGLCILAVKRSQQVWHLWEQAKFSYWPAFRFGWVVIKRLFPPNVHSVICAKSIGLGIHSTDVHWRTQSESPQSRVPHETPKQKSWSEEHLFILPNVHARMLLREAAAGRASQMRREGEGVDEKDRERGMGSACSSAERNRGVRLQQLIE